MLGEIFMGFPVGTTHILISFGPCLFTIAMSIEPKRWCFVRRTKKETINGDSRLRTGERRVHSQTKNFTLWFVANATLWLLCTTATKSIT